MATIEEIEGVLRRCDWANQTLVLLSHGVRTRMLSYDLTPLTPDYRAFVGMDVKVVVEDGMVTSVTRVK